MLPKNYDLVEPNPNGCRDIKNLFKQIKIKHTKPNLYELPLDDFSKKKLYDLVITEGWPGGHLNYDRKMFKKLSSFVKPENVYNLLSTDWRVAAYLKTYW